VRGKYRSYVKFLAAKLLRARLRAKLRSAVDWSPLEDPIEGYTIIIGVASRLKEILRPNLRFLFQQQRANLKQVVLAFDHVCTPELRAIVDSLRVDYADVDIRDAYYTVAQSSLADRLALPYVYSWLSWCIALRECRTRYALLHDYDAFLLYPTVCEERYRAITQRRHQYVGSLYYSANGIEPSDELATTFEMIVDAAFLRANFSPLDLFNHAAVFHGKSVDFDTLLHAQSRRGTTSILTIPEEHMVHPSQLIHQFTEFVSRLNCAPLPCSNLLLIPYIMSLGESDEQLVALTRSLVTSPAAVPLFGRYVDATRLTCAHALWLTKQAMRLEHAVHAAVRPAVADYFRAVCGCPVSEGVDG
jgi:hypothetical protein